MLGLLHRSRSFSRNRHSLTPGFNVLSSPLRKGVPGGLPEGYWLDGFVGMTISPEVGCAGLELLWESRQEGGMAYG